MTRPDERAQDQIQMTGDGDPMSYPRFSEPDARRIVENGEQMLCARCAYLIHGSAANQVLAVFPGTTVHLNYPPTSVYMAAGVIWATEHDRFRELRINGELVGLVPVTVFEGSALCRPHLIDAAYRAESRR